MTLEVYLYGKLAGRLDRDASGTRLEFEYTEEYLVDPEAIALSRRLPLEPGPAKPGRAGAWFDDLLPEGDRRRWIARRVSGGNPSTYTLLEWIGAECAGAVRVVSPGAQDSWRTTPVSEEEIGGVLAALATAPLGPPSRAARLSLAGAQDKIVLVREADGSWSWPEGGYPSTHIVKPEPGRLPGLAANEHACMELARRAGLRAARTETVRFGRVTALVVERFDRTADGKRIHQEDFKQALGSRHKYQSEGGAGLADWFGRTGVGGWELWDQIAFAWLIGNEDAHAKNFSIQYRTRGDACLSPVYDAVCTLVYGSLTRGMAWNMGGTWQAGAVTKTNLHKQAVRCGLDGDEAVERTRGLGERMHDALAEMKEEGMDVSALEAAGFEERFGRVCGQAG